MDKRFKLLLDSHVLHFYINLSRVDNVFFFLECVGLIIESPSLNSFITSKDGIRRLKCRHRMLKYVNKVCFRK